MQFIDERDAGQGHGKRVALRGAFLGVSINVKICGLSVGVNEDGGQCWAKSAYILEGD